MIPIYMLFLAIAVGLLIIRATRLGRSSDDQGRGFASKGDRVLIITAHPDDETMVRSKGEGINVVS